MRVRRRQSRDWTSTLIGLRESPDGLVGGQFHGKRAAEVRGGADLPPHFGLMDLMSGILLRGIDRAGAEDQMRWHMFAPDDTQNDLGRASAFRTSPGRR